MRSTLQVITTPTADTPGTTLLLNFPNKRYVVGSLAEGTQRAAVQAGAKLLKVQEFFVTGRSEWKNVGGLVGVILTLADSLSASRNSALEEALRKVRSKAQRDGVSDDAEMMRKLEDETKKAIHSRATFFGPPNLNYILATTRRFVFRKGMPVDIHEIRERSSPTPEAGGQNDWAPTWSDENIKVWAISILPRTPGEQKAPRPISPRKRSVEEAFAEDSDDVIGAVKSRSYDELSPAERDFLTVKAVVHEMFDSSWRLDTLHETPLAEVKLPATIFIRDAQTHKIVSYQGPLPDGKQVLPDPDLKVLVRRPWPGALVESLPRTSPAKEAVSYIIRNHPQRGKFNVQRAKDLKLKPGPDFSKLAQGLNVVNEAGETITPDMVLGEGKEGGGVAVVDIPSPAYIEALIERPEWQESKVMAGVGAIFWICGKGVASDSRVHKFMRQHNHLKHIVSSCDYCPNNIAFESSATSTVRLRKIDPDRYGVPVHDVSLGEAQPFGGDGRSLKLRGDHPLPDGVQIAARGHVLDLEPSIHYSTENAVPEFILAEAEANVPPEALEDAAIAQKAVNDPDGKMKAWLDSLPPGAKDAEIITLGTGSALPSKYRNVSSTLVRVPGWGNILFDCGENTLGQLKRVFSRAELGEVLQNLKLLTISHMHADHHLGITSVIKAWYEEVHGGEPGQTLSPAEDVDVDMQALFKDQRRLAVIAEPAMLGWLYEYSFAEDFGYSRLAPIVVQYSLMRGIEAAPGLPRWFTLPEIYNNLSEGQRSRHMRQRCVSWDLLGVANIEAVKVSHCHGARAISITLPSGFKVSFSGDCRPSKQFMQIGMGSTVCIHEATFDDELQGDAIAKKHSTTSEALSVAEGMQARACVLTHFSQRYQKVPILERVEEESPEAALGAGAKAVDDVVLPQVESGEQNGDLADDITYADQGHDDEQGQQYEISKTEEPGPSAVHRAGEAVTLKLKSDMKVCVAFDYMRVKVGDIAHMEKFTPALLRLFAEEDADEGDGGDDVPVPVDESATRPNAKEKKKNKKKDSQRRN